MLTQHFHSTRCRNPRLNTWAREGKKRHPNLNEEVKLSLQMIGSYRKKNPKDLTKKLLELISQFSNT
jgi:hypothetical protein